MRGNPGRSPRACSTQPVGELERRERGLSGRRRHRRRARGRGDGGEARRIQRAGGVDAAGGGEGAFGRDAGGELLPQRREARRDVRRPRADCRATPRGSAPRCRVERAARGDRPPRRRRSAAGCSDCRGRGGRRRARGRASSQAARRLSSVTAKALAMPHSRLSGWLAVKFCANTVSTGLPSRLCPDGANASLWSTPRSSRQVGAMSMVLASRSSIPGPSAGSRIASGAQVICE